jgi:hypothetical protein
MGEFYAMTDAQRQEAAELLIANDQGYLGYSADDYLAEIDRRVFRRHTAEVGAYAERLDGFTRGLLAFTLVIVLQTTALIGLEVEATTRA